LVNLRNLQWDACAPSVANGSFRSVKSSFVMVKVSFSVQDRAAHDRGARGTSIPRHAGLEFRLLREGERGASRRQPERRRPSEGSSEVEVTVALRYASAYRSRPAGV
jgi:hypothetical protein